MSLKNVDFKGKKGVCKMMIGYTFWYFLKENRMKKAYDLLIKCISCTK